MNFLEENRRGSLLVMKDKLNKINRIYDKWKDEEEPDGQTLDDLMDVVQDIDSNLVEYIKITDGNELTDYQAIELIMFRLELMFNKR